MPVHGLDPAKCQALTAAFFARVPNDEVLRTVYPAHLRCAIEGVSQFLTQFVGGPPEYAHGRRWNLSLREAHARFRIGPRERDAWLENMRLAIDDIGIGEPARSELRNFFERSSAFLIGHESDAADGSELNRRWEAHLQIERLISHAHRGDFDQAIALAEDSVAYEYFKRDRAALVTTLAMLSTGAPAYVGSKLRVEPSLVHELIAARRTFLHAAAATGSASIVDLLLELGSDPNALDAGGHAPLYSAANSGVVRSLVNAGADVNASGGVKRATALHMAARHDRADAAAALLNCGANIEARDSQGETPLRRAVNCGKLEVAAVLLRYGADVHSPGSKGLTPLTAARTVAMKKLLTTQRA